jgi:hydroxyethylthiazole kinase-like sugar kinase family protein
MDKFLTILIDSGPGAGNTQYVNASMVETASQDLVAPTTEINLHLIGLNKMVQIVGTGFDGSSVTAVTNALKSAFESGYVDVIHPITLPVGQAITSIAVV